MSGNVATTIYRQVLDLLSGRADGRRLSIFTYHRVLPEPDPLLPGEPTEASFALLLDWFASLLTFLPLPEAVRRLQNGTLPRRAACITFDDGYRNNYEVARPLLNARGIPATFFVATGVAAGGGMWNDLVIESFRMCDNGIDLRSFGLRAYDWTSADERNRALNEVLETLKYTPRDERNLIAETCYQRYSGRDTPELMMTSEQIRGLAADGHEIGAHTVTHPILSTLNDAEAAAEISDSRNALADVTGVAPRTFAYPNGRPGTDFADRHMSMVADAGFELAVSTSWGVATPRSALMALPRYTPWETSRRGVYGRIAKTHVQSFARQRLDTC